MCFFFYCCCFLSFPPDSGNCAVAGDIEQAKVGKRDRSVPPINLTFAEVLNSSNLKNKVVFHPQAQPYFFKVASIKSRFLRLSVAFSCPIFHRIYLILFIESFKALLTRQYKIPCKNKNRPRLKSLYS